MKKRKRIWSESELLIAYSVALWEDRMNFDHQYFVDAIGQTTLNSFAKQVANFRYLLGREGFKLDHTSKKQREMIDKYDKCSKDSIFILNTKFLESRSMDIEIAKSKRRRSQQTKRVAALNAQIGINFDLMIKKRGLKKYIQK
ncbi:hypothetical protein Phi19:2_gp079 [Cellulophaga phage phi19:2]|uniref:Uncharacterized protein n=3 Tax=Cellulophaga phage phiST TaxID=756282 RepID=M4T1Q8_9CAUD|nr:hypothetical protein CGPG_00030 [Cellulophaga phage phiST]AGH56729.1 hypothetical protein CGPG_00030 [Cellulophaga phage phiST]AGO47218.1 hypothetical protein PhiST_gp079 [Cellulophaga phage phiST]AGO48714.1 hypothetical protein Phi19:2_gp079 [Cellulophaga phage phi19:2]AGO49084.1 hypothetical protein Phi13:1_gp073 [Cellulophaga phage phi13:1]